MIRLGFIINHSHNLFVLAAKFLATLFQTSFHIFQIGDFNIFKIQKV